jgi:2-oxoglutarate dehydrogenase E2 component (dihydrolipoamide succinyltransferase)
MNIVVPQLGESVIEARVAKWLKKAGDQVSQGDPLVELETDKIDLEVNADASGVLSRIDRQEGDDVKVGEVLGVIEESASAQASKPDQHPHQPDQPGQPDQPRTNLTQPDPTSPNQTEPVPHAEVRATATAKKVAAELGVDLSTVKATGEGGRVTKDDVQKAAATNRTEPDKPRPSLTEPRTNATEPDHTRPNLTEPRAVAGSERSEERVRMSKRRATIAKRLVEAQHTAAMLTTFNEVDMTAVQSLRARRKEGFQKAHGVNLGLSSFFVKAAVGALKAFPKINAEIQGDEMVLKRYYDIGIAVGASSGLVVPVLRDADRLSFWDIEAGIKDFAKRAEDGTLTLPEISGGTFTITNGGVFGSLLSTPILNPPQVGILGLHKIEERPVAVNGQVVVRPMMYVALSYDHRIVDGLEAVQFLVKVKEFIEDPGHLLIEG